MVVSLTPAGGSGQTARHMSQPIAPASEQALVRAIGVRGLAANILTTTIGAGIFVLPALAAGQLGTAAPLAYLACAVAMTLVVASFAMAGSRVSLTGGIYAYVEVAFGPFVGFLAGVLIYLACLLAAASVSSAMAASVGLVIPSAGAGPGKALLLGLVLALLAAMNVRGVALGTHLVEFMTASKLLPLVLLVGAGLRWVGADDLRIGLAPPSHIAAASLTLIFAFMGIEVALVPSGEIRDPARTVPRAVFLALATSTLIYLAVQLVAHATLGADLQRFTDAPLAEAATRVFGPWGRALMLAGGTISMLGFMSGDALGTPRNLFAFARDGFFPALLARLHPRFHTPAPAIVAHAALVWTAACAGSFGGLAVISNVALLTAYLLCCASAVELARRDVRAGGTPFVIPGGPLVPAAGCLVVAWLLAQATGREWAVTGVTLAVATGVYLLRARRARA
jgi:amino acid transporter